ncbi:hypothetical protein DICPUDRAFT_38311 [Dictyostelium purpureum]|uniref:Uncharacterized protein n=1 Tax=Dictyostelium purpureum TaxID=5786 RepID=F0ZU76_DICPU|nr:uncharacterized protein DICPUDRAFT_38311 [Dictyostelium purpureum]EGC32521.1 hypothetical protein DICPUDRAFT_38311 [Dictyostelium purpureum]|eukprot:XP_003290971.1 hypothetical protein DICPUDRAFT_38311 [Dictyostelium purpureum]
MKLVNIANTLLIRGARKHVPLICFPDRRGLKQQPKQTVASAPPAQSPKLNKNANYIDFTKAPKRLPMRKDEMELVIVNIIL